MIVGSNPTPQPLIFSVCLVVCMRHPRCYRQSDQDARPYKLLGEQLAQGQVFVRLWLLIILGDTLGEPLIESRSLAAE